VRKIESKTYSVRDWEDVGYIHLNGRRDLSTML
jgi:hypothetical protein